MLLYLHWFLRITLLLSSGLLLYVIPDVARLGNAYSQLGGGGPQQGIGTEYVLLGILSLLIAISTFRPQLRFMTVLAWCFSPILLLFIVLFILAPPIVLPIFLFLVFWYFFYFTTRKLNENA
jgi:hypothetical protein